MKRQRGGRREGAGRPRGAIRTIKRQYRFAPDEIRAIEQALNILREEGNKIRESDFVREAIMQRVNRVLAHKLMIDHNNRREQHEKRETAKNH